MLKENYKGVEHQHKTNEAERSPCSISCSIAPYSLEVLQSSIIIHCGSISCFTLICTACSVYTVLCKRLDAIIIIITLVLQKHTFFPVKLFYLWTLSQIPLNWEQIMCFFRQAAIGDTTVVHPLTQLPLLRFSDSQISAK